METVQKRNCVLDQEAIVRKMKRMALQIAEQNHGEKKLVIAGVNGNGAVVAKNLIDQLENFTTLQIEFVLIRLNKKDPANVQLEPETDLQQQTVILVDDVANTGRTMLYALKPFLLQQPKKIQTLVLVERSHKLFPIQTDYAGLSIATTLQEHITVETQESTITGAWLF
jgi:pyrimidine operon attenuation protein/uracil phosphoribosyltransferase